jgi:hypothetical protein
MNEQRFGREIKAYLNQSLDLAPTTLDRLKAAREAALAKQRAPGFELVPAWAGRAFGSLGLGAGAARWLAPIVIAAAALFGYQQWQASQAPLEEDPMAEIDTELLKGDLPIDAYLDKGFKQWLKGEEE